ncbi:MAG TPA: tetratricopeptide repeat protein, partial [Acidobacteriota bacterium]|nr:tetratricopeptide repeat protein [Acidobacteriota bacterium]
AQWVPFVMVLIAVEWIVKRSLSRWQLLSYFPFIVLSGVFSWWAYQAQITSEENNAYIFSFSNWVNSPIRDIAIYFKVIAWPIGLFFRATPPPPVELWQVLIGWGLIVAWGVAAWKLPAYRQAFLWGGGWFLLFLSPMLNLVPGVLVPSDRYLYIAILGPLFPVAFWLEQKPLVVSTSILLAISLVFGILTFNYLPAWQDDYSLWDNAVSHNPMNKKTLTNFAVTARGLGKIHEEYIVLSHLLTLEPQEFKCHVDLGIAAHKLQQYEIAAKHLSYVYKDYPKFQEDDDGCFRLGHALVMIGQPKQACPPLTQAIQLRPFFPQYWYTLGEAYKALGDSVNALHCYRRVRDLNPIYTEKVQPKIIALEEEVKRASAKPSSSNP